MMQVHISVALTLFPKAPQSLRIFHAAMVTYNILVYVFILRMTVVLSYAVIFPRK